jgi:hypothetical protein
MIQSFGIRSIIIGKNIENNNIMIGALRARIKIKN